MCTTPASVTAASISRAWAASSASGFSQSTCLPARAAAIVGSACRWFGSRFSSTSTSGSATSSCQSATWRAKPKRSANSVRCASSRPATDTSRGAIAGGPVMWASVIRAWACARPMNA